MSQDLSQASIAVIIILWELVYNAGTITGELRTGESAFI